MCVGVGATDSTDNTGIVLIVLTLCMMERLHVFMWFMMCKKQNLFVKLRAVKCKVILALCMSCENVKLL